MREEARETAVTGEPEHHAGVGSHGEESAMPDADDDERHEGDGTLLPKDVDQDLEDRLADVAGDGFVEILDGEEE